jgi:hypothetical protein
MNSKTCIRGVLIFVLCGAILGSVIWGCRRELPVPEVIRWDSAGVEIVESLLPAWEDEERWTVDPDPFVDIGAPDGPPENQLYVVVGAARFPDGRIVIANRGTDELLFYDSAGDFLDARAGEGGGPGEFWGLYRLWLFAADSLVAYDELERRVSIFNSDGDFVRSWNPRMPGAEASRLTPMSRLKNGSLLFGSRPDGWVRKRGTSRDSLMIQRFDPDGLHLDSLGVFPWAEHYRPTPVKVGDYASNTWVSNLPFGLRTKVGPFNNGFYVARGESYRVEVYSPSGSLMKIIRRPVPNRLVKEQDQQRLKSDWLSSEVDGGEGVNRAWVRGSFGEWVQEMEFPETMPAYGRIVADLDGNLWIWEYSPPGNPLSRATVFDSTGQMLGTVDTPPVTSIFQIGEDYILAFDRDALDVEHVRMFRLVK